MSYTINPNAKNRWARNAENTMDLSLETDASSVYLDNGRTLEQEIGEGSMVSNVATVDSSVNKVIDGTLDGAYESLVFKGKSLVNLCPNVVINYTATSDWDGFNAIGQASNTQGYSWKTLQDLKPNTKYFISCYVETFDVGENQYYLLNNRNDSTVFEESLRIRTTGLHKWVLTTKSEFTERVHIALRCQNAYARGAIKIKNIMIIEYQEGMENWDIPYFEGLCDVKMPILKSVGKNLAKAYINNETIETIENSYVKVIKASNATQDIDYTDKTEYIPIKPNTHYSCSWQLVSGSIQTKGSVSACFAFCDKNKEVIKWVSGANQLSPKNAYYIKRVRLHWGNTEATLKDFKFTMMLEENKSVTEFEPYKTSILTTPEQVVLRKVGDVCDSYDASTGEYIQRIGEVVYNNTNVTGFYVSDSYQKEGCTTFMRAVDETFKKEPKMISNLLPFLPTGHWNDVDECLFAGTVLVIRLKSTKASNVTELQEYLSQHPLVVQYELAEPITTTIEPSTIPFAYENGHIILESGHEGQSLLPTLEYSTVINKTGQVENVAKTIQRQEKQLTMLEQMLIQNIINLDYNNTLLTLKNEMEEML